MKTTKRATIVLSAAAAAAALACCPSASEKSTYTEERAPAPMAAPAPLRYEDSASVAVTAVVEAID
jgi:hypothetical protein